MSLPCRFLASRMLSHCADVTSAQRPLKCGKPNSCSSSAWALEASQDRLQASGDCQKKFLHLSMVAHYSYFEVTLGLVQAFDWLLGTSITSCLHHLKSTIWNSRSEYQSKPANQPMRRLLSLEYTQQCRAANNTLSYKGRHFVYVSNPRSRM